MRPMITIKGRTPGAGEKQIHEPADMTPEMQRSGVDRRTGQRLDRHRARTASSQLPFKLPQVPFLDAIVQTDQGIVQLIAVERIREALLGGHIS